MGLEGIFETEDGSSLDQECTLEYVTLANQKTASMVTIINEEIMDSLCSGDVAVVLTYTSSFGAAGNEVS